VRRAKHVDISIKVPSERIIEITATGSLRDNELLGISEETKLPVDILQYHWKPWQKVAQIQLPFVIQKLFQKIVDSEELVVIAFTIFNREIKQTL
jgi:hypothetical protein